MAEWWCSLIQENNISRYFVQAEQYILLWFKSSGDTWLGARANREKTVARWGILHQTAQAVFFPILWNAETVSHPDNACINRRPHDPALPSFAAIRWQGMKRSLEPWSNATNISQFCKTLDTAIVRTTTSVSVACIISLVNPWWNEWEAWNWSRVSASSWVQDRSERSAMAEGTAFWPYVEMTCFRWGWNSRNASARRWNRLSLLASQRRKLFQSTGMLVLLETWRWLPDPRFIRVCACPPHRCPRQHLFEPRLATYVLYMARTRSVHSHGTFWQRLVISLDQVFEQCSTINNLDINVWSKFRFRYHSLQAFHQVGFAGLVHYAICRQRRGPSMIFVFEEGIHIIVSGLTRYVHPWEEMHIILQVAYFGSWLCRFLSWLRC